MTHSADMKDCMSLLGGIMERLLVSPAEAGQDMNPANIVDGLFAIARSLDQYAKEIQEFRITYLMKN